VPEDHLIRRIKQLVEAALNQLSPRFEQMYQRRGASLSVWTWPLSSLS